jgi:hypothetical protein
MRDIRTIFRTVIDVDSYARAVRTAAPPLSREAVGVMWAQYAIETGRGAYCWNWNIGNLKVTRSQADAGVPFFMLPNTWEILGGKRVVFQPPHEQTWFRHFDSLADAMGHHVGFLRRKYGAAWAHIVGGDPTRATEALKAGGYFTGSLEVYASSMRHLHAEFMRTADWPYPVEPNEVTVASTAHGSSVVDWALEAREADRRAKLDAELCEVGIGEFCGASRFDDDNA